MSDPSDSDRSLTGSALLADLKEKLARRQRRNPELFRVVEIHRDSRGRLVPQGQIWHSDLDHVRRFGRAVAANSVSQKVVIADSAGAVVENIPLAPPGAAPAGWAGWRDQPLPPAPPRKKPRPTPARVKPPGGAASAPVPTPALALPPPAQAPAQPPVQPAAAPAAFDPESTAPLPPGSVAAAAPPTPADAVAPQTLLPDSAGPAAPPSPPPAAPAAPAPTVGSSLRRRATRT